MNAKDIRELTDAEIKVRITEESDRLLRMRMNNSISAIENPTKITGARRMIARLRTILRERELKASSNQQQ